MLKASVEMVFQPQSHNYLKMCVVNMCVNPEKAFEDGFYHGQEILRKWNTYFNIGLPIWHGNSV